MHKGDKVSTEQGEGELWEYDADDDEWMVMVKGGLLSFPTREIRLLERQPVAEIRNWAHTYEVHQALRFIEQLKDRGDEPGEMMYDLLAPLAEEVKELRAEVAKLREGR